MNIETLIDYHRRAAKTRNTRVLKWHTEAADYLTELLADIRGLQVTEPDVAAAQLIKT